MVGGGPLSFRYCPVCRDEFFARVVSCPDCFVDLVEELPAAPAPAEPVRRTVKIDPLDLLDVSELDDVARDSLRAELEAERIAWLIDGDVLSVPKDRGFDARAILSRWTSPENWTAADLSGQRDGTRLGRAVRAQWGNRP